jgi:cytochrome c-type biogenesis protein CcmH
MLVSLEERLLTEQDDLDGWMMLARSSFNLGNYSKAAEAYEHVLKLTDGGDSLTQADFGEVLFIADESTITGRAGTLFESALQLDPDNTKALFYGGMTASRRGDKDLAIKRWELFLSMTAGQELPPELTNFLHSQIAFLKGEPVPSPHSTTEVAEVASDAIVVVNVTLGLNAASASAPNSVVWIIARDPTQPNPPVAVVRRSVADLPTTVALSDSNSMVAARPLSGLKEFEVIARVSSSGGPQAVSGDWFGTKLVVPAEQKELSVTIDQQVP